MELYCPKCNFQILADDINNDENMCICSICNRAFDLSIILDKESIEYAKKLLDSPPNYAWVKRDIGKIIIGVPMRSKDSIAEITFHLLFSAVSFFGFFQILIEHGILWSLLLLPFVLFSIYCFYRTFNLLFGKIEIIFTENECISIFTGMGKIGEKYIVNLKNIKKIHKITYRDPNYNYDPETVNQEMKQELHIVEEEKTIKIPLHYMKDKNLIFLLPVLRYFIYKSMK